MTTVGTIVTYVCTWWLILFMVLPWGVSPVEHPAAGHETGAPAKPHMLIKLAITTVLAGVVTYGIAFILESGLIELRPPSGLVD